MGWLSIRLMLRAVIRTILCMCNIIYGVGSYVWWINMLRPLRWIKPEFYYAIEGTMYRWLQENVAYWLWSAGYTVVEVGDDISECISDESIVMINHQSTADVPVLMNVVSHANKGTLAQHVDYIMDVMFRFAPFGWVGIMHGDFFIRQGRDTRNSQLEELTSHLCDVYCELNRKWILLFPEGGFLYKRLESSQEYARKHGYPVLEHVTLPRIGAIETMLKELSPLSPVAVDNGHKKRNCVKWIIDVTIGYPERPLDILEIMLGTRQPCQVVVHYRRFRADSVPCDHDALLQWLYDRWTEKDQLLDHFHRTGSFPVGPSDRPTARLLALSDARSVLLNTLFIVSAWFAVRITSMICCVIAGLVSG